MEYRQIRRTHVVHTLRLDRKDRRAGDGLYTISRRDLRRTYSGARLGEIRTGKGREASPDARAVVIDDFRK